MFTIHYITTGMMERKETMEAETAQEVEDTVLGVHGDDTLILSIIEH